MLLAKLLNSINEKAEIIYEKKLYLELASVQLLRKAVTFLHHSTNDLKRRQLLAFWLYCIHYVFKLLMEKKTKERMCQ